MRKLAKESGERIYWDERICEDASFLEKGFITNRSYQELNDVGKKTAYLELSGLTEKGLIIATGKGRSVRYVAGF